ncbi:MAG: SDR family oxidoreductase [Gammaproteobacteria bacterium]
MEGQMQEKVALVTGAGSGIGRACSLALATAGARVVVSDVAAENGRETTDLIERAGGEAVFVETDVSSGAAVKALFDIAVRRFGGLDCAVNNAGIEGLMAPTAECSEENWDRTIAVNLKGVWLCMREEIPRMLERGGGSIVNMASVAGLVGFQNLPAYCASKGGIVQLTKTAALEYAGQGIRVNAICPGVIRTAMVDRILGDDPEQKKAFTQLEPIGRFGRPEEIADAALWLCSDASSFVTGDALAVDGGFTAR